MQQAADVAWMVSDAKLLGNQRGDERRGPDAGIQAVSDGTTFNDVMEVLALPGGQVGWTTPAMAFLEAFHPIVIPRADPVVNPRAMHVQHTGDLRWRVSIDTEQDGLEA